MLLHRVGNNLSLRAARRAQKILLIFAISCFSLCFISWQVAKANPNQGPVACEPIPGVGMGDPNQPEVPPELEEVLIGPVIPPDVPADGQPEAEAQPGELLMMPAEGDAEAQDLEMGPPAPEPATEEPEPPMDYKLALQAIFNRWRVAVVRDEFDAVEQDILNRYEEVMEAYGVSTGYPGDGYDDLRLLAGALDNIFSHYQRWGAESYLESNRSQTLYEYPVALDPKLTEILGVEEDDPRTLAEIVFNELLIGDIDQKRKILELNKYVDRFRYSMLDTLLRGLDNKLLVDIDDHFNVLPSVAAGRFTEQGNLPELSDVIAFVEQHDQFVEELGSGEEESSQKTRTAQAVFRKPYRDAIVAAREENNSLLTTDMIFDAFSFTPDEVKNLRITARLFKEVAIMENESASLDEDLDGLGIRYRQPSYFRFRSSIARHHQGRIDALRAEADARGGRGEQQLPGVKSQMVEIQRELEERFPGILDREPEVYGLYAEYKNLFDEVKAEVEKEFAELGYRYSAEGKKRNRSRFDKDQYDDKNEWANPQKFLGPSARYKNSTREWIVSEQFTPQNGVFLPTLGAVSEVQREITQSEYDSAKKEAILKETWRRMRKKGAGRAVNSIELRTILEEGLSYTEASFFIDGTRDEKTSEWYDPILERTRDPEDDYVDFDREGRDKYYAALFLLNQGGYRFESLPANYAYLLTWKLDDLIRVGMMRKFIPDYGIGKISDEDQAQSDLTRIQARNNDLAYSGVEGASFRYNASEKALLAAPGLQGDFVPYMMREEAERIENLRLPGKEDRRGYGQWLSNNLVIDPLGRYDAIEGQVLSRSEANRDTPYFAIRLPETQEASFDEEVVEQEFTDLKNLDELVKRAFGYEVFLEFESIDQYSQLREQVMELVQRKSKIIPGPSFRNLGCFEGEEASGRALNESSPEDIDAKKFRELFKPKEKPGEVLITDVPSFVEQMNSCLDSYEQKRDQLASEFNEAYDRQRYVDLARGMRRLRAVKNLAVAYADGQEQPPEVMEPLDFEEKSIEEIWDMALFEMFHITVGEQGHGQNEQTKNAFFTAINNQTEGIDDLELRLQTIRGIIWQLAPLDQDSEGNSNHQKVRDVLGDIKMEILDPEDERLNLFREAFFERIQGSDFSYLKDAVTILSNQESFPDAFTGFYQQGVVPEGLEFNQWTYLELDALDFLVDRYGWDASSVGSSIRDIGKQSLFHWLAEKMSFNEEEYSEMRKTDESDPRLEEVYRDKPTLKVSAEIMQYADDLMVSEGVIPVFYGENWRQKYLDATGKQRVSPIDLIQIGINDVGQILDFIVDHQDRVRSNLWTEGRTSSSETPVEVITSLREAFYRRFEGTEALARMDVELSDEKLRELLLIGDQFVWDPVIEDYIESLPSGLREAKRKEFEQGDEYPPAEVIAYDQKQNKNLKNAGRYYEQLDLDLVYRHPGAQNYIGSIVMHADDYGKDALTASLKRFNVFVLDFLGDTNTPASREVHGYFHEKASGEKAIDKFLTLLGFDIENETVQKAVQVVEERNPKLYSEMKTSAERFFSSGKSLKETLGDTKRLSEKELIDIFTKISEENSDGRTDNDYVTNLILGMDGGQVKEGLYLSSDEARELLERMKIKLNGRSLEKIRMQLSYFRQFLSSGMELFPQYRASFGDSVSRYVLFEIFEKVSNEKLYRVEPEEAESEVKRLLKEFQSVSETNMDIDYGTISALLTEAAQIYQFDMDGFDQGLRVALLLQHDLRRWLHGPDYDPKGAAKSSSREEDSIENEYIGLKARAAQLKKEFPETWQEELKKEIERKLGSYNSRMSLMRGSLRLQILNSRLLSEEDLEGELVDLIMAATKPIYLSEDESLAQVMESLKEDGLDKNLSRTPMVLNLDLEVLESEIEGAALTPPLVRGQGSTQIDSNKQIEFLSYTTYNTAEEDRYGRDYLARVESELGKKVSEPVLYGQGIEGDPLTDFIAEPSHLDDILRSRVLAAVMYMQTLGYFDQSEESLSQLISSLTNELSQLNESGVNLDDVFMALATYLEIKEASFTEPGDHNPYYTPPGEERIGVKSALESALQILRRSVKTDVEELPAFSQLMTAIQREPKALSQARADFLQQREERRKQAELEKQRAESNDMMGPFLPNDENAPQLFDGSGPLLATELELPEEAAFVGPVAPEDAPAEPEQDSTEEEETEELDNSFSLESLFPDGRGFVIGRFRSQAFPRDPEAPTRLRSIYEERDESFEERSESLTGYFQYEFDQVLDRKNSTQRIDRFRFIPYRKYLDISENEDGELKANITEEWQTKSRVELSNFFLTQDQNFYATANRSEAIGKVLTELYGTEHESGIVQNLLGENAQDYYLAIGGLLEYLNVSYIELLREEGVRLTQSELEDFMDGALEQFLQQQSGIGEEIEQLRELRAKAAESEEDDIVWTEENQATLNRLHQQSAQTVDSVISNEAIQAFLERRGKTSEEIEALLDSAAVDIQMTRLKQIILITNQVILESLSVGLNSDSIAIRDQKIEQMTGYIEEFFSLPYTMNLELEGEVIGSRLTMDNLVNSIDGMMKDQLEAKYEVLKQERTQRRRNTPYMVPGVRFLQNLVWEDIIIGIGLGGLDIMGGEAYRLALEGPAVALGADEDWFGERAPLGLTNWSNYNEKRRERKTDEIIGGVAADGLGLFLTVASFGGFSVLRAMGKSGLKQMARAGTIREGLVGVGRTQGERLPAWLRRAGYSAWSGARRRGASLARGASETKVGQALRNGASRTGSFLTKERHLPTYRPPSDQSIAKSITNLIQNRVRNEGSKETASTLVRRTLQNARQRTITAASAARHQAPGLGLRWIGDSVLIGGGSIAAQTLVYGWPEDLGETGNAFWQETEHGLKFIGGMIVTSMILRRISRTGDRIAHTAFQTYILHEAAKLGIGATIKGLGLVEPRDYEKYLADPRYVTPDGEPILELWRDLPDGVDMYEQYMEDRQRIVGAISSGLIVGLIYGNTPLGYGLDKLNYKFRIQKNLEKTNQGAREGKEFADSAFGMNPVNAVMGAYGANSGRYYGWAVRAREKKLRKENKEHLDKMEPAARERRLHEIRKEAIEFVRTADGYSELWRNRDVDGKIVLIAQEMARQNYPMERVRLEVKEQIVKDHARFTHDNSPIETWIARTPGFKLMQDYVRQRDARSLQQALLRFDRSWTAGIQRASVLRSTELEKRANIDVTQVLIDLERMNRAVGAVVESQKDRPATRGEVIESLVRNGLRSRRFWESTEGQLVLTETILPLVRASEAYGKAELRGVDLTSSGRLTADEWSTLINEGRVNPESSMPSLRMSEMADPLKPGETITDVVMYTRDQAPKIKNESNGQVFVEAFGVRIPLDTSARAEIIGPNRIKIHGKSEVQGSTFREITDAVSAREYARDTGVEVQPLSSAWARTFSKNGVRYLEAFGHRMELPEGVSVQVLNNGSIRLQNPVEGSGVNRRFIESPMQMQQYGTDFNLGFNEIPNFYRNMDAYYAQARASGKEIPAPRIIHMNINEFVGRGNADSAIGKLLGFEDVISSQPVIASKLNSSMELVGLPDRTTLLRYSGELPKRASRARRWLGKIPGVPAAKGNTEKPIDSLLLPEGWKLVEVTDTTISLMDNYGIESLINFRNQTVEYWIRDANGARQQKLMVRDPVTNTSTHKIQPLAEYRELLRNYPGALPSQIFMGMQFMHEGQQATNIQVSHEAAAKYQLRTHTEKLVGPRDRIADGGLKPEVVTRVYNTGKEALLGANVELSDFSRSTSTSFREIRGVQIPPEMSLTELARGIDSSVAARHLFTRERVEQAIQKFGLERPAEQLMSEAGLPRGEMPLGWNAVFRQMSSEQRVDFFSRNEIEIAYRVSVRYRELGEARDGIFRIFDGLQAFNARELLGLDGSTPTLDGVRQAYDIRVKARVEEFIKEHEALLPRVTDRQKLIENALSADRVPYDLMQFALISVGRANYENWGQIDVSKYSRQEKMDALMALEAKLTVGRLTTHSEMLRFLTVENLTNRGFDKSPDHTRLGDQPIHQLYIDLKKLKDAYKNVIETNSLSLREAAE